MRCEHGKKRNARFHHISIHRMGMRSWRVGQQSEQHHCRRHKDERSLVEAVHLYSVSLLLSTTEYLAGGLAVWVGV
jgi:hypothetical protein